MKFFRNLFTKNQVAGIILSLLIPAAVHASAAPTLFLELKGSFDISGLGADLDVTALPSGDVVIASPSTSGLYCLKKRSQTVVPIKIQGVEDGYFFNPASVEADGDGHIWIANPDMHEILVCDANGNLLRRLGGGELTLERPSFLFPLPNGTVGAWDERMKTIVLFFLSENQVRLEEVQLEKIPGSGEFICIRDPRSAVVCLDSDAGTLRKIEGNAVVAQKELSAKKSDRYARIVHIAYGPEDDLYFIDASGKRLISLSPDFTLKNRFPLHENLFVDPGRFSFQADHLWLIDEGRKALIHFRVREAATGFEHQVLGEEYLALGRFEAALKEISAARELGIEGADGDMIAGKSYYGLGRYDDALAAFARAKKAGGISADFHTGNALFHRQRFNDAALAYISALEKGVRLPLVRFNLAQTRMAQQRFQEAGELFARLLSEDPDHHAARSGLARSFMRQKQFLKAIDLLAPLQTEKGIDRIARHDLGICYLETGRYETAIPLLERAAAEGPFYKEAMHGLEKAYQMTGNAAAAEKYRTQADQAADSQRFTPYLLEDDQ